MASQLDIPQKNSMTGMGASTGTSTHFKNREPSVLGVQMSVHARSLFTQLKGHTETATSHTHPFILQYEHQPSSQRYYLIPYDGVSSHTYMLCVITVNILVNHNDLQFNELQQVDLRGKTCNIYSGDM